MCVLLQELQKSTGIATVSLHNAMPKFLGSLGIEFGFRQADSVHVVVPKEFERDLHECSAVAIGSGTLLLSVRCEVVKWVLDSAEPGGHMHMVLVFPHFLVSTAFVDFTELQCTDEPNQDRLYEVDSVIL
ncbi:hypothetical protein Tco_1500373 [Tanacetum coccineum]